MKRVMLAVLLLGTIAVAQDFPRYELSTGYSYGSLDNGGSGSRLYGQGWSGSIAANLKRWVGVEADASGQYNSQSLLFQTSGFTLNSGFYSFLAGPKLAYRRGRVTPFVHGLVGLNRTLAYDLATVNATNTTITVPYENNFGSAVGGGFDVAISKHIALRSQADYFLTGAGTSAFSGQQNNFRVVAAVVFAFGGTNPDFNARQHGPSAPAPSAPSIESVAKSAAAESEVVPAPQASVALASAPTPATNVTAPVMPVVAAAHPAPIPVQPTAIVPQPTGSAAAQSTRPPAQSIYAPASNDVVVSEYQNQSNQPQESLGDIARRYREQKLHRNQ